MRYAVGILLLATPAFSSEPVYSWRTRADEPERIYLYLDGKQIGGWCYVARHYRPFDGKNWGPPADTAPVRPPGQRVLVSPPQKLMVIPQPSSPPPQLRGPLRVRAGTIMGQVVTDMTMQMFTDAIPRAIADSLASGQYQSNFQFSVTRSPQQSGGQSTPPSPSVQAPQRRWVIPRP
jgi:hypothetical protein